MPIVGYTVRMRGWQVGGSPVRAAGAPWEENPFSADRRAAWVFGSRASAHWWCIERGDFMGGDRDAYRVCALVRR